MKHLILGTAGHVDHGKTTLVKALTGIDCDTHKEEKRRGLTINLGFAHLDFGPELSLGIVDVPGHRDFVHTMVGGTSGLDLGLLVVAADAGVMPQTREHLQIMAALGVKAGLTALTRIDLATDSAVAQAERQIDELLEGSFLAGGPVVPVSAAAGTGIGELKAQIQQVAQATPARPVGGVFRMFVDRVFSARGFGTVVTGSVLGGTLREADNLHVLPGPGKPVRVRRLERHGQQVRQVQAGDRAAIALAGMSRAECGPGAVLAKRALRPSPRLDARLRLFKGAGTLQLWSQLLFHIGTFETCAKVHLLDTNRANEGQTAFAQIHLAEPCIARLGDRFVVRSSSGERSVAGGEILDNAPLHHRRRPPKLLRTLRKIAVNGLPELVAEQVRRQAEPIPLTRIAANLNCAEAELTERVDHASLPPEIAACRVERERYLCREHERRRLHARILAHIRAYHERNPIQARGVPAAELVAGLRLAHNSVWAAVLPDLLEGMVARGALKRIEGTWSLAEHAVELAPEQRAHIERVETFLREAGMRTPLLAELREKSAADGISAAHLDQALRYLVEQGRAHHFDGDYIHDAVVRPCRLALLRALNTRKKGMTVGEFRDLIDGNRKLCIILLGIYDGEGVIRRIGNLRIITEAGRTLLAQCG